MGREVWGANLEGVNLWGAHLEGADLGKMRGVPRFLENCIFPDGSRACGDEPDFETLDRFRNLGPDNPGGDHSE